MDLTVPDTRHRGCPNNLVRRYGTNRSGTTWRLAGWVLPKIWHMSTERSGGGHGRPLGLATGIIRKQGNMCIRWWYINMVKYKTVFIAVHFPGTWLVLYNRPSGTQNLSGLNYFRHWPSFLPDFFHKWVNSIIPHQYMYVKIMHIDAQSQYWLLEQFDKSVKRIILHC